MYVGIIMYIMYVVHTVQLLHKAYHWIDITEFSTSVHPLFKLYVSSNNVKRWAFFTMLELASSSNLENLAY